MKNGHVGKKILEAFMLAIPLLLATGSVARASSVSDGINLVLGFNGSEELVYASPGVCVNSDGSLGVFTSTYDSGLATEYVALQTEEQTCLLEYGRDFSPLQGCSMGVWMIHEGSLPDVDAQDSAFLRIGYPHQNEQVTAVFYNASGDDLTKGTSDMVLRDMDEDGALEADGFPADVWYPAALISGEGELVGMLLEDGVCMAAAGSQEIFYGTAGGNAGESEPFRGMETAPPLPSRNVGVSASAGNINSTEMLSGMTLLFLVVGIIAAVVIIAVIVIVVILAGRKKAAPETGIHAAGMQANDGSAGAAASVGEGKEQACKLWLLAKGGCMNGRVYPVGRDEITIGRDASMVIRFPAQAAGVSRIHAKLYWQGEQLMLMDCNSTSGTFLKRMGKLAPMTPVALQNGDIFYIGEKANSFEVNTGR